MTISRQDLTAEENEKRSHLVETMVLNTLITGVQVNLSQILRVTDPPDILTAITRIRRELQLNYFKSQKFPIPNQIPSQ